MKTTKRISCLLAMGFMFIATVAWGQPASEPLEARILGERRTVPMSRPMGHRPAAVQSSQLPPDGAKVIDYLCRLGEVDSEGWLRLEFPAQEGQSAFSRRALPCRQLEQLQRLTSERGQILFRISGETTVYAGQAYLLVTKVLIEEPAKPSIFAPASEPVAAKAASQPTPAVQPDASESPKPATPVADTKSAARRGPSSEDIARALLDTQNPATPVLAPRREGPLDQQKFAASVAPVPHDSQIEPSRAEMVIDRLVIFTPEADSQWIQVRFQGDNTLREPPLRVLPSQLLSNANSSVDGTSKYRISGELTEYQGRRYLLLRKVVYERQMGQF